MSRLVDPTICPDCRSALAGEGLCPGCGLRLQGPLAAQLWQTMRAADSLIGQLRAQAAAAPAVPPTAPRASAAARPLPPVRAPLPRRRGVSTLSVPVVLLSLGALCLLVAGVVFIAVTWSSLGLTGRTLVLGGFTVLLAAVAMLLTRKGLRGAAETFWVIVAGMLVMDLLGGREAGVLGLDALGWRGASALVGGVLLGLGALLAWWASGQPVQRLYAVQVTGALGAAVVTATNAWAATRPAVGTAVAIPALALLALACRSRVRLVAAGAGMLALTSWLVLLGIGITRATELAAFATWWMQLRGWPLPAASAAALAVVVVRPRLLGRAAWVRPFFAGMVMVPLVVLANAPRTLDADRTAVVASATLVAVAAVTRFAPLVWARAAGFLAGLGIVGAGSVLLGTTLGLVLPSRPAAPATLAGRLTVDGDFPLAGWVPVVVAVAVAAALAGLVRIVPDTVLSASRRWRVVSVLVCGMVGAGVADLVVALEPPLWTALIALGLGATATAALTWVVRHDLPAAVVGSTVAVLQAALTLALADPSEPASAVVLSLLAAATAVVFGLRDREGGETSVVLAGLATALLGGLALDRWGLVMGADAQARSLVLAAYAVVVGVLADPASRRGVGRLALETAALVLGVGAVVGYSGDRAMALTVVGTGVCLVAVVFRDRNDAGWLGAGVLALATLVRATEDVTAPEAYTLPAATLLLAVGLWRLRTAQPMGSLAALGSGLSLALVPSLLLTLEEPVSVRGALVAAGGLVALALGVWQRLLAPFVFGAAVTAVLALRHLEPVAQALPRWIALGAVGVALLAVGITWEARLRDVRSARRYLAALH